MRLLVLAIALTACGRSAALRALDDYDRIVTATCNCTTASCANAQEHAWLKTGIAADRAGARFTGDENSHLFILGLYFDQCYRRARGEPVEMVDY